MKKIVQAWTGISLVQGIVAGLVIGALLGTVSYTHLTLPTTSRV